MSVNDLSSAHDRATVLKPWHTNNRKSPMRSTLIFDALVELKTKERWRCVMRRLHLASARPTRSQDSRSCASSFAHRQHLTRDLRSSGTQYLHWDCKTRDFLSFWRPTGGAERLEIAGSYNCLCAFRAALSYETKIDTTTDTGFEVEQSRYVYIFD